MYYTHRSQWDNLLILMVRTNDDILSKKIEYFLHSYNYSTDYGTILKHFSDMVRYIDHAKEMVEEEVEPSYR